MIRPFLQKDHPQNLPTPSIFAGQPREEKREEVSELPLLRETCRHQRDELRELQKFKHEVPELKRQRLNGKARFKPWKGGPFLGTVNHLVDNY